MEQIFTFVMDHWILSTALVLVLILIVIDAVSNKRGGAKLAPPDAVRLINTEQAVVVDLRDKSAYDTGHITGAIHLPQVHKFKDKPIILVDATGLTTNTARQKLLKEGFTRIYVLSGGLNAWKEAGLPLIKQEKRG